MCIFLALSAEYKTNFSTILPVINLARPSRKRPGLYVILAWQMLISTPSELQIRKNGKKDGPAATAGPSLKNKNKNELKNLRFMCCAA